MEKNIHLRAQDGMLTVFLTSYQLSFPKLVIFRTLALRTDSLPYLDQLLMISSQME
jgi:hypothetical protein